MRRLLQFGFLFFISVACKSKETVNESSTEAAATPQSLCSINNPVSSDKATGEQIYKTTGDCLFNQNVHEIHFHVFGKTLERVLQEGCSGRFSDPAFGHIIDFYFDGQRINNVAVKVRGNTSNCNVKRQFKFKFDETEMYSETDSTPKKFPENKDRTFFTLPSFSIRSSLNDPTMVRERLATMLFASSEALGRTLERGGPTYRVSFVKVFVTYGQTNGNEPGFVTKWKDGLFYDYKGMYSLTEDINGAFLKSRLQAGSDKLKNFYMYEADLGMASFDPSEYAKKPQGWSVEYANGEKVKSDDTMAQNDAKNKLLSLFTVLSKNPAPTEAELERVINIESIVNYTAGAILAKHWDSMLANRNNDFLFFNPKTGTWQIFVWDLDNSLGAGNYHGYMSDDIFNPASKNSSLLFTKVFSSTNPNFRARLKQRLKSYVTVGFANATNFDAQLRAAENTIKFNTGNWEVFQNQTIGSMTRDAAWTQFAHQRYEDIKNFMASRRDGINKL